MDRLCFLLSVFISGFISILCSRFDTGLLSKWSTKSIPSFEPVFSYSSISFNTLSLFRFVSLYCGEFEAGVFSRVKSPALSISERFMFLGVGGGVGMKVSLGGGVGGGGIGLGDAGGTGGLNDCGD